MNMLSVVDLPAAIWQPVREQFPDVTVKTELAKDRWNDYVEWADIVFGNISADWALRAKKLAWLQSVSAGMDAYQSLAGSNIRLTSARGVHHQPIAHHVLLMILALNRQLPNQLREQAKGEWNRQPDALTSVVGQQVGIIGYGGIGAQLAPLVRALGMRVVGVSRSIRATLVQNGAELWPMSQLNQLLQASDHIVLCLPLTPETADFMDDDKFCQLKPGAYFYNVSRGELVDEPALLRALKENYLAGAALDVFAEEPLHADHPLRQFPNVIVTPHIAGHYRGLREATFRLFFENLNRFIAGESLVNEILIE